MPEATSSPIDLAGQKGEKHLINVAPDRGEAHSVKLAPCLISLGLGSKVFNPDYGGDSNNTKMFDAVLDGGTQHPDCVWLFRGEDCYLFNVQNGKVERGPVKITEEWVGFPTTFAAGIDAAVWAGPSYPNLVYFYRGKLYIRYDVSSGKFDVGPTSIATDWYSSRGNWLSDSPGAALHAVESKYPAMIHFFKGSEYLRHNLNNGCADAGPIPIIDQWQFPEPFKDGIDLAFYGTGIESQMIYFIKGDQFFVYDTKASKVSVSTHSISSKFQELAQFVRRPQLFLVESYRMTTYYGDLTPGNLTDGPDIGPGSDDTYVVRIKRTEVTDITKTSTVLESQDQRVVNDLNESIKNSSSDKNADEKYDYHMDASFKGEASMGLNSGEVSGGAHVNGGTNDVRKEFAKAAEEGVTKQVQSTSENRKQTVDTVSSSYNAKNEFESIWTRRITNTTDRTISLAYAQLAQEYITLIVLEDVKIAFANGEISEVVELSQMDNLLEKYLVVPSDREIAKKWVVNELKEVIDYQGTPCSILKEISPQRYQFDPALTSKLTLNKPDGTLRKEIVVNGVIISHVSNTQLTDLMVLTEVNVG